MGARRGGGQELAVAHPGKSPQNLCALLGAFLLLFLHMGAFLLRYSHYGGLFATLSPYWGPFLGLPPPLENFCGRPCCRSIAAISIVNPLRISEFLAWFFTIIVIRPDRFNIFECWDGGGGDSEMNVRLCVPFSTYTFCYFTIIVAFCWYQYFHYVCTNSRHMNVESVI